MDEHGTWANFRWFSYLLLLIYIIVMFNSCVKSLEGIQDDFLDL